MLLLLLACGEASTDPAPPDGSVRDGATAQPGAVRELGEACERASDCRSELCVDRGARRSCTVACDGACPADAQGNVYDCAEGLCVRRDTAYRWLVVVDTSIEVEVGSAGADICGASVVCGEGAETLAEEATLLAGSGETGARSGDPDAARDDGVACSAESPSDFVTLGLGGVLGLRFPRTLLGCRVSIADRPSELEETYDVYVCTSAARTDCLDGGPLWRQTEGGRHTFDVAR